MVFEITFRISRLQLLGDNCQSQITKTKTTRLHFVNAGEGARPLPEDGRQAGTHQDHRGLQAPRQEADVVHPAEGAEAVQAHRGPQVLRLRQEEDGRVRQEVHVQVQRRVQEVADAAASVGRGARVHCQYGGICSGPKICQIFALQVILLLLQQGSSVALKVTAKHCLKRHLIDPKNCHSFALLIILLLLQQGSLVALKVTAKHCLKPLPLIDPKIARVLPS